MFVVSRSTAALIQGSALWKSRHVSQQVGVTVVDAVNHLWDQTTTVITTEQELLLGDAFAPPGTCKRSSGEIGQPVLSS